jgi:hypothetical protein
MPLWGNQDLMPGSKKYLLPNIWLGILSSVIGAIAACDFFIYAKK